MIRVRRLIAIALSLCAVPMLAGCATAPPPASAGTHAAPQSAIAGVVDPLVDIEARFDSARAFAELLLPLLPDRRAAQIRAGADRVALRLAQARIAATATDRLLAGKAARDALDAYLGLTGG